MELVCYQILNKGKSTEKKDYRYGWSKFNDVSDLWTFIGWLNNEFDSIISFHYLQYYNSYLDTFNTWLLRVKENENEVARFKCGQYEFTIEFIE